MEDMYQIQFEYELLGENWLTWFVMYILDTKYKWADAKDVIKQQTYLNTQQLTYLLFSWEWKNIWWNRWSVST
jgi:hypothetical protein